MAIGAQGARVEGVIGLAGSMFSFPSADGTETSLIGNS